MNGYKLSDALSMRLIQIFQEAIMTGVDGADLLRMVRLELDESNSDTLVMTQEYKEHVKESYRKLEEQALRLQSSSSPNVLVKSDGNN